MILVKLVSGRCVLADAQRVGEEFRIEKDEVCRSGSPGVSPHPTRRKRAGNFSCQKCIQDRRSDGYTVVAAKQSNVDTAENQILKFPGALEPRGNAEASAASEDFRLLKRIAHGDQQAVATLYKQRGTLLYSLLLRMLGDDMEAQEVMQDTFLQIWRRAATYDPARSAPLSWMILIARGLAVDRLRARGRRQVNRAAFEAEVAALEVEVGHRPQQLERDELATVCAAALHRLPEVQAHALQLAFLRGWTHEEIAQAQNEPLGTIKARIRRGLQALRQTLKEYHHG
jgi:RNA polymerase sigma-70 factor (ECF subfamily)